MRKKTFCIMSRLLFASALFLTPLACQNDVEDSQPPVNPLDTEPVTYTMRLQGGINLFDGLQTRGAEAWTDGSKLIMQFMDGQKRISGTAIYKASDETWQVTPDNKQTLTATDEESCEIYYFEQPASMSTTSVSIGAKTIVYADKNATYLIDEETKEIIVQAQLAPLTSRLRLTGKAGRNFGIAGLKTFTAYDISNNRLDASTAKLTGTIGTAGSSSYAYVLFASENRRLTCDAIDDNGNALGVACFTRSFEATVLAPATSGHLTLPTATSMGKWQMTNKNNEREITLPAAPSTTIGKVTYSAAPVSGNVTDLGNGSLLECGFVYALGTQSKEPDFSNGTRVKANSTQANFDVRITGLSEETTYYVRAYVYNERGPVLGPSQSFTTTTRPPGTTIDRNDFDEEQGWD